MCFQSMLNVKKYVCRSRSARTGQTKPNNGLKTQNVTIHSFYGSCAIRWLNNLPHEMKWNEMYSLEFRHNASSTKNIFYQAIWLTIQLLYSHLHTHTWNEPNSIKCHPIQSSPNMLASGKHGNSPPIGTTSPHTNA